MTTQACGVYLDYSKNLITEETLHLLVDLAQQCGLSERIRAMFAGEKINVSEDRAVLHVALRAPTSETITVRWHRRGPGHARRVEADGPLR